MSASVINRLYKEIRIIEYNKNPHSCLSCGIILDYYHRNRKYCGNKCARKMQKRIKKVKLCKNCGKEIFGRSLYCSFECSSYKEFIDKRIEEYSNGLMDDVNARHYFRKLNEKVCSICGLTEWNGNEIPLVVDHIDGNHRNNIPENLRFVCCNCDALLPTYKSKNNGNGREYRRIK